MSYQNKTFNDRVQDPMWRHSEDYFENLWPGPWFHYGLAEEARNMPVWKMGAFISHTPDYIAALGSDCPPVLVEVQGTGTNANVRTHKFKQKKWDALGAWNRHSEVTLWLWDDKTNEYVWTSWVSINLACSQGKTEFTSNMFNEGRPGFTIPVDTVKEIADTDRLMQRYG